MMPKTPTMKFTLDKKILVGFIACTFLLLVVAIIALRNSQQFIDTNAWVNHTHQTLYELEQVLENAVNESAGARGFIITGDKNYLDPYNDSRIKLGQHLKKVTDLTSDNPTQQRNLKALSQSIDTFQKILENYIDTRQQQGFAQAQTLLTIGKGKSALDEIRARVEDAKGIEDNLLQQRKEASEQDAKNFIQIFIGLLVIIAVVLIAVYMIISTNLRALRRAEQETANKNWNLTGNGELAKIMQGDLSVPDLSQVVIDFLSRYLNAQVGVIYVADDNLDNLILTAGFAIDQQKRANKSIRWGEGVVGQVANEKQPILLTDVPQNYVDIDTGFGKIAPQSVLAMPLIFENEVLGVVELGSLSSFTELQRQFLNTVLHSVAIAVASAQAREKMKELLEETRAQSEELQAQQEELRQVNEELEEQAQNLKQQQEELQVTNEELEEQTQALEMKNKEVEFARKDIEQKSKQLEVSSKYKSEFLANMSHELRTPLNSLLILSRDLADNKNKNLTEEQIESAEIINKSGYDLLGLINEVLDLSKIEAGKMTLSLESLSLKAFASDLTRNFKHQTNSKGLEFEVAMGSDLPETILTDAKRVDQIVKNLLSNAIKFTDKGSIKVGFNKHDEQHIAITVADTGIGIANEKQMAIFEAFHQGDGSTSRKYGGTGLGLSISRELAKLLGGEIKLESRVGEGSTFTLVLPTELHVDETSTQATYHRKPTTPPKTVFEKNNDFYNYPTIADDRENIGEADKVVLVVEDDLKFAEILLRQAHNKGFKCLAASTGEDGLLLAEKFKPHAMILDIDLPGINGHQVLAELKANPVIRHIPVHIISVNERTLDPIKEGAIEYLTKPVEKKQLEEAFNRIEHFIDRKMKNLLIVEDDENGRKAIMKLIGNGDVKCLGVGSGTEALNLFKETHIDCIVLDLGLPDMSGFELIYQLEKAKEGGVPPIIVYTGKELSREENDELQKYAETIIIKGVKSEERLLDETALFLHRTISNLPEAKQKIITGLYDRESVFTDKKILVVDDDMRNVFALSKVLKERGMEIVKAENGLKALEMLDQQADIDLVLMDIMMPEMDGYEAMQKIREQARYNKLPIIALTAKAMKEDRQKCIDAGANDYISKPIDVERLLSLIRVWLSK